MSVHFGGRVKFLAFLGCAALAACSTPSDAGQAVSPPTINGWYAGPQLGTVNYSPGIVLKPLAGGVLQFDIPTAPSQIDALAKNVTVLPATLTVAYRLTAPVYPTDAGSNGYPALISVCFQRYGDNWSGHNKFQQYRWYATFEAQLVPGANIFSVDFNSLDWYDIYGQPASANLAAFNAAKANPQAIYITFGWNGGRSHGVSGAAHFNLLGAN